MLLPVHCDTFTFHTTGEQGIPAIITSVFVETLSSEVMHRWRSAISSLEKRSSSFFLVISKLKPSVQVKSFNYSTEYQILNICDKF